MRGAAAKRPTTTRRAAVLQVYVGTCLGEFLNTSSFNVVAILSPPPPPPLPPSLLKSNNKRQPHPLSAAAETLGARILRDSTFYTLCFRLSTPYFYFLFYYYTLLFFREME